MAKKQTPPATPGIPDPAGRQAFLAALMKRGETAGRVRLTEEDEQALCERIIQDAYDSYTENSQFRLNQVDNLRNWRGTTEPKDFPFEDCANIHVPFTSVHIEQMLARFMKAIFGGELIAEFSCLDKQYTPEELNDFNQWFQWELLEVIKIKKIARTIIRQMFIHGISIPMPYYENETRELHQLRRFQIPQDAEVDNLVADKLAEIAAEVPGDSLADSPDYGIYKFVKGGQVAFGVRTADGVPELVADITRRVNFFNGVRVPTMQLENMCIINSASTIDSVPFVAERIWLSSTDYRIGLEDGTYIDHGEEENKRIINTADIKVSDFIPMETTREQDEEEGTDSRDVTGNRPPRQFMEVIRWEGWWILTKDGIGLSYENILGPAKQFAVWVVPRAKRVIKIEHLEDLNKDGSRTGVKFGFIEEPDRFISIGLAGWLRHVQAALDAISNQRLDAGLLTNVPWGFYKPSAGFNKEILVVKPGRFLPVADPQAVNMPKSNWQPVWSFNEERSMWMYGGLQAGQGDPAVGGFTSKRQSASEFVGTTSAIDLRTGDLVDQFMESFRELMYKILGLYQMHAPRKRMYQIAGENGVQITKEFETDKLNGKIYLRLAGSLQQANVELQKQVALDMFQVLLNPLLIQASIVQGDTIYTALKKLHKIMGYEGVPIHKPDMPPVSDDADMENRQMMAKHEPIGPTLGENFNEHMAKHMKLATDPNLDEVMDAEAQQMLADHLKRTVAMQQQAQVIKQMQAQQAAEMQKQLAAKGVNPGQQGGSQPGAGAEPGTPDEGVQDNGQA